MAWVRRQSETGNVDAYLVDGYLPRQELLEEMASSNTVRSYARVSTRWDSHDADSVYEVLALGIRSAFCARRPRGTAPYQWSEAWLLKPKHWGQDFQLEAADEKDERRRLLITLYSGCAFGRKCVRNLVRESGFRVIPVSRYRDPKSFRARAIELLDEVSLPFKAPCIIAEERLSQAGYEYTGFGQ